MSELNDFNQPIPGLRYDSTLATDTTPTPLVAPDSNLTDYEKWLKTLAGGTYRDLAGNILGSNLSASDLEYMMSRGWASPDLIRQAQVQKDAWLHAMNNARYGYGPGLAANYDWQQTSAANPALNNVDWSRWYQALNQINPANYNPAQPVLQFSPGAFPDQYRNQAQAWLRSQGFQPQGSLGPYGYSSYRYSNAGMPRMPGPQLTAQTFQAIPDAHLRRWMQYWAQQAGLIGGNYTRPL